MKSQELISKNEAIEKIKKVQEKYACNCSSAKAHRFTALQIAIRILESMEPIMIKDNER